MSNFSYSETARIVDVASSNSLVHNLVLVFSSRRTSSRPSERLIEIPLVLDLANEELLQYANYWKESNTTKSAM